MENKIFISDQEKEALVNYLSGNFGEQDSLLLNAWLNNDKGNKLLLDQLTDIWQASRYTHINKQINVKATWEELQGQIKQKHDNQWKHWLQIAAIVIVSLLAGGMGNYFLQGEQETKAKAKAQLVEYTAPLGSRSFVKLNDGSKVWLNSGTTIKYENTFGAENRNIGLSGEAFFKVAKNKDLPFVVNTGEISVTAIGTEFNVKAYENEKTIETTLIEGSVKLGSNVVKLHKDLFLKTNEKAVFTKKDKSLAIERKDIPDKTGDKAANASPSLKIIQSVDPAPIISWKEKRWVISNEKLGDLSVKLERRYDVNIIFDNEILKEYSFGGTLEDETLEQVLNAISYAAPIKYEIEGKTVYIMADGKKMEKFKDLLLE